MITTVVFDLDDTLYDEIEYCKSGFAAVAEFLANLLEAPAAERIFATFWKQFTAGNRTKTFNAALDKLGMDYDDKLIGELIEVYRNHVPKMMSCIFLIRGVRFCRICRIGLLMQGTTLKDLYNYHSVILANEQRHFYNWAAFVQNSMTSIKQNST